MDNVSALLLKFANEDSNPNSYAFLVFLQWDDVSERVLSQLPLPHLLCPSHLPICGVLTPAGAHETLCVL